MSASIIAGKTQFEIRRAEIRRAIAPLPAVEAVGRWQKFERVDTEFGKIGAARLRDLEVSKIRSACLRTNEGEDIAKGPYANLAFAAEPVRVQAVGSS